MNRGIKIGIILILGILLVIPLVKYQENITIIKGESSFTISQKNRAIDTTSFNVTVNYQYGIQDKQIFLTLWTNGSSAMMDIEIYQQVDSNDIYKISKNVQVTKMGLKLLIPLDTSAKYTEIFIFSPFDQINQYITPIDEYGYYEIHNQNYSDKIEVDTSLIDGNYSDYFSLLIIFLIVIPAFAGIIVLKFQNSDKLSVKQEENLQIEVDKDSFYPTTSTIGDQVKEITRFIPTNSYVIISIFLLYSIINIKNSQPQSYDSLFGKFGEIKMIVSFIINISVIIVQIITYRSELGNIEKLLNSIVKYFSANILLLIILVGSIVLISEPDGFLYIIFAIVFLIFIFLLLIIVFQAGLYIISTSIKDMFSLYLLLTILTSLYLLSSNLLNILILTETVFIVELVLLLSIVTKVFHDIARDAQIKYYKIIFDINVYLVFALFIKFLIANLG